MIHPGWVSEKPIRCFSGTERNCSASSWKEPEEMRKWLSRREARFRSPLDGWQEAVMCDCVKYLAWSSEFRAPATVSQADQGSLINVSPAINQRHCSPSHSLQCQALTTGLPLQGDFCQQLSECQWADWSVLTQTSFPRGTTIPAHSQNRTDKWGYLYTIIFHMIWYISLLLMNIPREILCFLGDHNYK